MTRLAARLTAVRVIAGTTLIFAAAIGLRAVQLGQPMSPRIVMLIGLSAAGGLGAAVLAWACAAVVRWLLRGRFGAVAAFVISTCAFAGMAAGSTALAWSVYDRLIRGHIDLDDDHGNGDDTVIEPFEWMDVVMSLGSGGYVFLTSGWRYLLPWPLPVCALIAGFAMLWATRTRPR